MSTVSSNAMGIYALNGNVTSPLTVKVESSFTTTGGAPAGLVAGDYYLSVKSDGTFNNVGKVAANGTDGATADGDLTLLSATTSSTLDASSTINEVAARNGTGGSTNYIASGAFSWNFSVDGLLDLTTGSGSATTLIDAARNQQFVIAKFTTDTDQGANEAFYVGQTLLESVSATGGVDDLATYSASLKGYGDLYKGV